MKRIIATGMMISLLALMSLAWTAQAAKAGEKASPKIYTLANTFMKYSTDPVLVKAIKEENAKGKSLDQIQALDKKWMATPGVADFMKAMIDSECGRHLASIKKSAPYFSEIFLTDNQGANVAMTDKTSDYWQGDEAKFIECFKGAAGVLFVDEQTFDKSSQSYLVHVSVPIREGGKAIGVLVLGVDPAKAP